MNWNNILKINPWTPMRSVFPEAKHLKQFLYHVNNDIYLIALPNDSNHVHGLPDAPFITLIVWAPSKSAALRYGTRDISLSVPQVISDPPKEITYNTNGSYGKLLTCKEVQSMGSIAEQASYHYPSGKFFHKCISTKKFIFYFIEREIRMNEKPYAIECRLNK